MSCAPLWVVCSIIALAVRLEIKRRIARIIALGFASPCGSPPSTTCLTPHAAARNGFAFLKESVFVTALTAVAVLEQLSEKGAQVLNLLALCRTPEFYPVWSQGPELLRRFARLLLKQGHPTLALEVAARGLAEKAYPNDLELMFCRALALARSGNPTRASFFVREMLDRSDLPPAIHSDALSLTGRIRKDMAARTSNRPVRLTRLREAFGFYKQAFDLSGDTFPGINAATLALLVGDAEQSRALASRVRDGVLVELDKPGKDRDYYLLATLAEAYLLLGDGTAAKGRYAQAVRFAHEDHSDGDIASMLRQLRLIREHLPIGDDLLGLFRLGPVVVFAGQGLDRPGESVRFPADPALEAAVRKAIKNELGALEANIGYCSPGCGSEILFGELMRERDAELHVVLPFAEDDFCTERLTYGLPELESWRRRYEELRGLFRVTRHFATTEEFLNDQVLYDFAGTFMQGLALTRAAQVGVEAIALVVQDPTPHPGSSDLTAFVSNWRRTGRELRIIDLAAVRASVSSITAPPLAALQRVPAPRYQRTVRAMLFADVAGFSGLPEPHLPAFFIEFLALVEQELKTTSTLFQNTWGDGLYIVFADVATCAGFALRLLQRLERFDFASFGFKLKEDKQLGVRIGLHTGPVFEAHDAIIGRNNYFGSHVSRAARIEPVTAPGCAFVSEQFAAALAMTPDHDFVCEYLGMKPLAKDYDVCPLYRLTCITDQNGEEEGNHEIHEKSKDN
jgi:class 3 adenylate cyclase/tetratricopeptide (TPR) repeat protein